MATIYSDNFDTDTSGSIPSGWTAVSGTWTVGTTAPVSGTQTLSCTTSVDGQKAVYSSGSTAQTDQEAYVSQIVGSAGYSCPIVRTDATTSKGYLALYSSASNSLKIYKFVSGSPSQLTTITLSAFTTGHVVAISIAAIGTTISARMWDITAGQTRPGTATLTVTDSTSTSGVPGLYWAKGTSGVGGADDFVWTDGAVAASAITMTGPTTGFVSASSDAFVVGANGAIASSMTVTLTDGASGTFYPSATVTISPTAPVAQVSYKPSAAGAVTISETNTGSLTNASSITYTSATMSVLIPVDNASIAWSPFNWDTLAVTDFAVPVKSKQTSTCGAYVKFKITGTTSLALQIDSSQFLTPFTSALTPRIQWRVWTTGASGALQTAQLTIGSSTLLLASGLTSGSTYEVEVIFLGASETTGDRWGSSGNTPTNSPTNIVRTQGFIADSGATVSAHSLVLAKKVAYFGDSITEGVRAAGTTTEPADHGRSAPWYVCPALNAEFGVIGYGAQGWTSGGSGNMPAFTSTWALHSVGRARDISAADYVFVMHGANSSSASSTTSWITAVRAANSTAWIFVVSNPGAIGSTNNAAGVAAYISATPSDTKVAYIDVTDRIEAPYFGNSNSGQPTPGSVDGLHPLESQNGRIGAIVADKVQALITAAGGGGTTYLQAIGLGSLGLTADGKLSVVL